MSEFSHSISKQVEQLEEECKRHQRDSNFYSRLLIQIALMQGGSIKIDPAFGTEALEGGYGFEINSTGFHLLKPGVANVKG